jgi:hypothetical protein
MSLFSGIANVFSKGVKTLGKAASVAGNATKTAVKATLSAQGKIAALGDNIYPGLGTLAENVFASQAGAIDSFWGGGEQAAEDPSVALFNSTSNQQTLGSSSVAMAMQAAEPRKGLFGIGDGQPGIFGIGDGKAGVFGIGTGVNKAKKLAAETARRQAESAALGDQLSPLEIKLKGDAAAAKAERKVQDDYDKPAGSQGGALPWIIGGLLALLAL